MAAEMATGVPNPAAPSIKAPKKRDEQHLMRRSLPTPAMVLDDVKVAGFDGYVVNEDGAEHDPADGKQGRGGSTIRPRLLRGAGMPNTTMATCGGQAGQRPSELSRPNARSPSRTTTGRAATSAKA